jgi:hypothetical protein
MRSSLPVTMLAALTLGACTGEGPAVLDPGEAHFSKGKGGGGGGGGSVVYRYAMEGDITSPQDGPTASMKAGDPFGGLNISGVVVTLGAPTGDVSQCKTGGATYSNTFGDNGASIWTGSLNIKKPTNLLNFSGTNDAGDFVQFSIGDATGGPVVTSDGQGGYSYEYTDARHFFGGNSTDYDGGYRCVNVTLTAKPVS